MHAEGTPILVGQDHEARLERAPFSEQGGQAYDENWIQRLIHDHPEVLPVSEIEPGFAPLVAVCREFPTRSGPVDNLLISTEGDIVLVEAKLWRNPEAKRKVVAQALDYATCLFDMRYSDIEAAWQRTLPAGERARRLYDLFPDADTLEEPRFIDVINRNLQNGRILILVVGDGIRSEVESLTQILQAHAGFHFTFGLVELAVFRIPGDGTLLIYPRTLLKTQLVERGIVYIEDSRSYVKAVPEPVIKTAPGMPRGGTITSEQFLEGLAERRPDLPQKLKGFLEKLSQLGVEAEFKRSLNLKWEPPVGKPINFGYIKKNGDVWTDAMAWFAPKEIAREYTEQLARLVGGRSVANSRNNAWVVRIGDTMLKIERAAEQFDAWASLIAETITKLKTELAFTEAGTA